VHRRDADDQEVKNMKNDPDGYCKVWREFDCNEKPYKWIVWPHSASQDWCEKIEGILP